MKKKATKPKNLFEDLPKMIDDITKIPTKVLETGNKTLKLGQDFFGNIFGGSGIKVNNFLNKLKIIDYTPFPVINILTDTFPYPKDGVVNPAIEQSANISVCANFLAGGRNPQACEAYGRVLNKEIDKDLACKWGKYTKEFGYPNDKMIDSGLNLVSNIRDRYIDFADGVGEVFGGKIVASIIKIPAAFIEPTTNTVDNIADYIGETDWCWAHTLKKNETIDDVYK